MSTQTSSVLGIANELAGLCRQHQNLEAIEKLYSDDIVSIEVTGSAEMPARMEGKEAIKGKNRWWLENHEVHGSEVEGPWPHGDRFILLFRIDITPKCGPMEGKRMKIDEAGLYTVADGKIVKEEFFYDMGEMGA